MRKCYLLNNILPNYETQKINIYKQNFLMRDIYIISHLEMSKIKHLMTQKLLKNNFKICNRLSLK